MILTLCMAARFARRHRDLVLKEAPSHLQETIEKTDANGKILPEMVSAVMLQLVTRAVSTCTLHRDTRLDTQHLHAAILQTAL
jgi:hypothetical protein